MFEIKNYLKRADILAGNRNLARPFTVHSYISKPNVEVRKDNPVPIETAVNCNKSENDLTEINNVNITPLTVKIKDSVTSKRFLCLFCVLMIILVVVHIALFLVRPSINICLSRTCIESASIALKHLDNEVDPCFNFYSFACGKFLKESLLAEDEQRKNIFSELSTDVTNKLLNIIKLPAEKITSKVHLALSLIYYKCMTHTNVLQSELQDLKSLFENLGGWPMVVGDKWNENNFDFNNLTLRLTKMGVPYESPFYFSVEVDMMETNRYRLQGKLGTQSVINSKLINKVAVVLGGDPSIVTKDITQYLELHSTLCKHCISNNGYEILTLKELSQLTGRNWTNFVQELLGTTNITITDNEVIYAQHNLDICMKLFFESPKRVQANYIFSEIVETLFQYLPGLQKSYAALMPKSETCVTIASQRLNLMMNSLYVKAYFNMQSKVLVEELVHNIQNEFMEVLKRVEWLDERTRVKAMEKLRAMKICIGFPDELLNNTKLENFYSSLELNFTTYLSLIMSTEAFNVNRKLKLLRKPVKNCYWIDNSQIVTIVNADYYCLTNGIRVSAAILHQSVFDKYRPNYLNYATAGVIIGHEITHGFDNQGKQFDKDGNYANWWSNQTSTTFKEKSQCIVDQYQQYIVPELNMAVDGQLTLGENIADNGGLKHSFLAYNSWVKRNGPEKMLPGLNYTYNQMFWIAFAQFWCCRHSLESIRYQMTDVHAPEMFRVIGTLSNIEKFAEDFNCPLGSPMNPKQKCTVW